MTASVVPAMKFPEPDPAPASASGPLLDVTEPATAKVLASIVPVNSDVSETLSESMTLVPRKAALVTAVISLTAAAAPTAMAPRLPPFSETESAPEPASAVTLAEFVAMSVTSPLAVMLPPAISAIVSTVT